MNIYNYLSVLTYSGSITSIGLMPKDVNASQESTWSLSIEFESLYH